MKQELPQDRAHRGGLSHSAMDALASVGILLVGVAMMIDNCKIGAGWASDGSDWWSGTVKCRH